MIKRATLLIFILFLPMMLSFIGCGGGGNGDATTSANDDQDVDPSQDIVKSIYVNVTGSDQLIMTAVDANDRYYSFYGIKDQDNLPVYFDRIVVDQRSQNDELEHYLTIELDAEQRPIVYQLPGPGDRIVITYPSDYEALVTYQPVDGIPETIATENPFSDMDGVSSVSGWYDTTIHPLADELDWVYQGNIKTCRDGNIPKITIERELDEKIEKAFPALRLLFSQNAKKATLAKPGEPDYYYLFNVTIVPGLYQQWEKVCVAQCQKLGIWETVDNVGKAVFSKIYAVSKSAEFLLDTANKMAKKAKTKVKLEDVKGRITLGIPLDVFIDRVANYWAGERTCSKTNYNLYRTIVKKELKITCKYNGTKEVHYYKPSPSPPDDTAVTPKLDFDFTKKCQLNEVEGLSAVATIPGYIGINFTANKIDGFLGKLIDGEDILLEEIPTLSGVSDDQRDTLAISLSPFLSGPGTYDNLGYIVDLMFGRDASIAFTTDHIKDEGTVDELPVAFSATSGAVTVETFGNQIGDRIKGTFDVTVTGYKEICDDPPTCEASYFEPIIGTLQGEFNGKIETSYYPVSVASNQSKNRNLN